jgi:HPt (histidine-containing phosphotransfer) domain-containing protein
MDVPIIEQIDSDLEVLMERFFSSSRKELDVMRTALQSGEFSALVRMGHTTKGTGYGYGFRGMGDIGLELEAAARNEDNALCAELLDRLGHYLDTVKVEFKR